VLVGTHNPMGEGYLQDRSGNRRFWTVTVGGRVLVEEIRRERDQIFAEAVRVFSTGEAWYLDQPDAAKLAESEANKRVATSTIREVIEQWWCTAQPAQRPRGFTMLNVIESVLKMPAERADQRIRTEIGSALWHMGF